MTVATTDLAKNSVIAEANMKLRSEGYDVIDAEIPAPETWNFRLLEHKGERRTMGANISNFYIAG